MKESIHIKNFGPLKDIDIEEIKPMTVFIGESASGKSTLLKVVVLMRYLYKMVNIRSYLKNANITKSPFKLRFDTLLHDGLENMLAADTQITYTVSINGNTYTIAYKDKALKANINTRMPILYSSRNPISPKPEALSPHGHPRWQPSRARIWVSSSTRHSATSTKPPMS